MRDTDGVPTIIDALVCPLSPRIIRASVQLKNAVERAKLLREGHEAGPDDCFQGVSDDEL